MQNILITGVSTGIGYHTTKYFLDKGFFVFGSVRKKEDATRLKSELGQYFHPLVFDVCDQESIDQAFQETTKHLNGKGLSLLVNNAGIAVSGPLKNLSIKELHHQFDVNVYGVLRVTQTFLPLLGGSLAAKHPPGKIVNISSVSGFVTAPFLGAYAMSKHALESMSDGLRRELSIYDIDVIVLEPGAIETEIWSKAYELDPKYLKTDYAPILKDWDRMIANSEQNALPATVIAEKIHRVLKQNKPKTRFIIAKKHLIMWLVKYIFPDRFLDKQLTKDFKKKVGKA